VGRCGIQPWGFYTATRSAGKEEEVRVVRNPFCGFIGHSYEIGKLKRVEAGLKPCRNICPDWFGAALVHPGYNTGIPEVPESKSI
jgi:hypothetical protein